MFECQSDVTQCKYSVIFLILWVKKREKEWWKRYFTFPALIVEQKNPNMRLTLLSHVSSPPLAEVSLMSAPRNKYHTIQGPSDGAQPTNWLIRFPQSRITIILNRLNMADRVARKPSRQRHCFPCVITESQRWTSFTEAAYLAFPPPVRVGSGWIPHIYKLKKKKSTPHHIWLMTGCLMLYLEGCFGCWNK